ncbi:MAG TPA: bifunctional DNA-formamidopyrimidine glycosylase/DNA-(apurinic or apyrimidinic site) lyase [Baekduia sp.]|nr:bifunctional DNA-formamidopyrimidine glycosylase/DNA-(apurinic or apyrimidinic site) lyase [Baekduia sp.]
MPELPEVETIRRQVAPVVEGRCIERLDVLDPRWCLPLAPEAVRDAVERRRVLRLGRRGKYLIWELAGEVFLVLHLRMTGTLLIEPPADVPYQRVVWTLTDGGTLRFCDPRRFGTGELLLGADALEAFLGARLGVEPLGGALDGATLRALARGRRAPVKAFLLDQRRIAGVGNIYADEALHRAGIHPLRPAGRLTRAQCDALAEAVQGVLAAGIDAGGATIDDFRHADGVMGAFQHDFEVHRRAGEPCGACGTVVRKMVVAGRGTYVCEVCQPRPRRPRAAGAGARNGRPAPSR